MAIITAVSAQKRKGRVNVFLDGKFFCGLESVTAVSNGIEVGRAISEDELALIQQKSEGAVAFDKAIGTISVRMRSEREIRGYLKEKGFLPQVVDECVEKLKEYGYVNDILFAKELVRSYPLLGKKALERKFAEKGLGQAAVDAVFDGFEEEGEIEKARLIAEKYVKTRANAKNLAQKLNNHLVCKGFSFEVARQIAREMIADVED